jgi:hypothetical protein
MMLKRASCLQELLAVDGWGEVYKQELKYDVKSVFSLNRKLKHILLGVQLDISKLKITTFSYPPYKIVNMFTDMT